MESRAFAGIFLNHDDAIPEETLSQHFKETKKLWKKSKTGSRPLLLALLLVALLALLFTAAATYLPAMNMKSLHTAGDYETFKYVGRGYCRSTCSGNHKNCYELCFMCFLSTLL